MNQADPVMLLRPGPLGRILWFSAAIVCPYMSFIMIVNNVVLGTLGAILVGALVFTQISYFLPGAGLELRHEEFIIKRVFFKDKVCLWSEIVCFEERVGGIFPGVVFNSIGSSFEQSLPDTYGKSPQKLVDLLNQWRERSLTI